MEEHPRPGFQPNPPAQRALDVVLALAALLLVWPLLLLLTVLVRLDSPGPAMHAEQRLGRSGKPFRIYKLRTLRTGTGDDSPVAATDDSRITRLGRWLRPAHLDELPQLWNILRGDMAWVGPRPTRPELWRAVEEPLKRRALDFRPGLTSPASIGFNCEDEVLAEVEDPERIYREVLFPAKVELDVRYLEKRRLLDDLKVIAMTPATLMLARERERCRRRVERLLKSRGQFQS